MKKHIFLAFFSGLTLSCAKPEAAKNEAPLLITAADSLKSSSPIKSTSLPIDKNQSSRSVQSQAKKVNPASTITGFLGKWIHESDSLAYLDISNSGWVSGYEGQAVTQDDKYTYTLVDKLPQFVDPEVKANFIVLANNTDTVYYELNGLTEETLSLTWYPTMKVHVYKRKK